MPDIIVIALCDVIANAQDWQEIETFGRQCLDWLCSCLELPNGIRSQDTFERVIERLSSQAFQACFRDWVRAQSVRTSLSHRMRGWAANGGAMMNAKPMPIII